MAGLPSFAVACALLSALSVGLSAEVRAQALPGPIAPAPQNRDTQVPPTTTPAATAPGQTATQEKPAPRHDIAGAWKLNRNDSDDGRKKIEQAHRRGDDDGGYGGQQGGGYPGSGYPYPGGYPGGYPGSGYPFPGGGGGNGPRGRNPGANDGSDESQLIREYIYPPSSVTLALKSSQVELTDDLERRRVFYIDGRKLQKPKDENYRELEAHWEGMRLVTQEKDPGSGQITRSFELSPDGRQLEEDIVLGATRRRSSVNIHYVYDIGADRQ